MTALLFGIGLGFTIAASFGPINVFSLSSGLRYGFWPAFGVAVGARSFPGIIAIHADADYVLNFAREMGVERQIEELGAQAGLAFVALLDEDGAVLAEAGSARDGPALEVTRPVTLPGGARGLLRVGLSTESVDRAWRRDRNRAIVLGLGVLALGAVGMAAIFYTQHRHLRDVRALEAEMARRERLATMGDMAAAVAHEVRNPLNAVSMGLQRLRMEFAPSSAADREEYVRFARIMEAEVGRLNTIVDRFLPFKEMMDEDRTDVGLNKDSWLSKSETQNSPSRIGSDTGKPFELRNRPRHPPAMLFDNSLHRVLEVHRPTVVAEAGPTPEYLDEGSFRERPDGRKYL